MRRSTLLLNLTIVVTSFLHRPSKRKEEMKCGLGSRLSGHLLGSLRGGLAFEEKRSDGVRPGIEAKWSPLGKSKRWPVETKTLGGSLTMLL